MMPDMLKINGIPALGFGTYPLTGSECQASVAMALELGLRHIDTAQMYGNEADVGAAIAASGIPRQEVFVTTKVGSGNLSKNNFLQSVRRSTEALQMPSVDLLLIHWPPTDGTPIEAVMDWLNQAADEGLATHIGISNFTIPMMQKAASASARKLVNNQVEFHPLLDQSRLLASAKSLGIALSAYCPIARGAVLTDPIICGIAKRLNETPAAVTLRWIIQQGVIAVPMTTKRANAAANLRALQFNLTPEDMSAISTLTKANRRIVSPASMAALWD